MVRLGPLRQHGLWTRPHWKHDFMSLLLLLLLDGLMLVSALLGLTGNVGDVEEEEDVKIVFEDEVVRIVGGLA
jgi:hypothetical protein